MGSVKLKVTSYVSSNGTVPIVLLYTFDRKSMPLKIGERIASKHWSESGQKVKKSHPDSESINISINAKKARMEKIVRDIEYASNVPTIKLVFDEYNNPTEKRKISDTESYDLFEVYDLYTARMTKVLKNETIKIYRTLKGHLLVFQKSKKHSLTFESINMKFFEEFTNYLFYEVKNQNTGAIGLGTNTVSKLVKQLNAFLADTRKRHPIELSSDINEFKIREHEVDTIFLNEDELEKWFYYKFDKENAGLEEKRDSFIVGCCTGLRFSDFTALDEPNFVGDKIRIGQEKTSRAVVIPIHKYLKEIRRKYKGVTSNSLPVPLSNQKMNKALKEIGKLIGFDEQIEMRTFKGNIETRTAHHKYELICTHTARRSFATNNYLRGIPTRILMQITGHKTEKAFMKYIRIDNELAAEELAKYWAD